MNALVHIMLKSARNRLRELVRKPAKLVMYLLLVAVMIGLIVLSAFTARQRAGDTAPMFFFSGILFLYVTLFMVIGVALGFSSGSAIFGMEDVNFLFVSPVNPRGILLYGVGRTAKQAFAGSLFILFQSNSLANFGIDYGGVLVTFACVLPCMAITTTASLLIYSATNGRPRRKLFVKCLTALMFLPLAVFAAVELSASRDVWAAVQGIAASPFFHFVPLAGWTAAGVTHILAGEAAAGLLYLGLDLLLFAGMVAYLIAARPDFYEDVLVATETAYERKRAVDEGDINAAAGKRRAVRVKRTGIPCSGAAALFGKHMRECFRENRLGFLTLLSCFVIVGGAVLSRVTGDLFVTLQVLMWMQVFLIGTGRGLKETFSHYIFMIPESSFKKIVWSSMEIVVRTLAESALLFGAAGVWLSANPLYALVCAAVYTLFSFLLIGINYVAMRVTGVDLSAGVQLLLYFLAVVVAMLPGMAGGIALGVIIGGQAGLFLGLLALAGWELLAGLVCFALSAGVLHSCDMSMLKQMK